MGFDKDKGKGDGKSSGPVEDRILSAMSSGHGSFAALVQRELRALHEHYDKNIRYVQQVCKDVYKQELLELERQNEAKVDDLRSQLQEVAAAATAQVMKMAAACGLQNKGG